MSDDSSPNVAQVGPCKTHAADEAEGEGGAEVAAGGAAGRAVTKAGVRAARAIVAGVYPLLGLALSRRLATPAGRERGV